MSAQCMRVWQGALPCEAGHGWAGNLIHMNYGKLVRVRHATKEKYRWVAACTGLAFLSFCGRFLADESRNLFHAIHPIRPPMPRPMCCPHLPRTTSTTQPPLTSPQPSLPPVQLR